MAWRVVWSSAVGAPETGRTGPSESPERSSTPAPRNGATCCVPGTCRRTSRLPRSRCWMPPSWAGVFPDWPRPGSSRPPESTGSACSSSKPEPAAPRFRVRPTAGYFRGAPTISTSLRRRADCIHELLADIGVITGYDASGRPRVNPDHLVRYPRERLFLDGDWEEGLDPFRNAGPKAVEQWREFEDDMLRWTILAGRDGRRGFAMPAAYSSADSKVRALDRISMADYMDSRNWTAAPLRWLVDYCCRGRLRLPGK